jgi:hypothetical protein
MNSLTLLEYNGIKIPQRPNGYINATKMCQTGGKLWSNFWQLKSTQDYVEVLANVLQIPKTKLTSTIQGGNPWQQGTWIHPRLASRLAQWISPEFAVVNDGWVIDIVEGRQPMPNEASHEGAIARGIEALLEATTNMSVQLTQVGLGVSANGQSIDKLTNTVESHGEQLQEQNKMLGSLESKGRRDHTEETRLLYREIIWEYYDGCCPIYRSIRLLEISPETNKPRKIVDERNRSVGQYDHFWHRNNNAPEDGWLISERANQEFNSGKLKRSDFIAAFQEFQRHLSDHLEKTKGQQLKLL